MANNDTVTSVFGNKLHNARLSPHCLLKKWDRKPYKFLPHNGKSFSRYYNMKLFKMNNDIKIQGQAQIKYAG